MNQQERENEMHKDPNNWKWGCFYYNKNDERLFLPKKNPAFGATMNFANPRSYLILFPVLFIMLLLLFLPLAGK